MPADPTKWPYNINSNLVDQTPLWREVMVWGGWPINKVRQVSVESLKTLMSINLFENLDTGTKDVISAIVEGRPVTAMEAELITITPERLTSLADATNKAEVARASIDVIGLLNLAVVAIQTGDLCGTQLQAKEKIDLLKWLGNKALPDAKSLDQQEVVRRVDRGRRKVAEMSEEEINMLTKQEILELMDG